MDNNAKLNEITRLLFTKDDHFNANIVDEHGNITEKSIRGISLNLDGGTLCIGKDKDNRIKLHLINANGISEGGSLILHCSCANSIFISSSKK